MSNRIVGDIIAYYALLSALFQLARPGSLANVWNHNKRPVSLQLLYGRFPRLKEWAYAGFTFDLIGAFWSHLSSGDPIYVAIIPLGFLLVLAISYWSWKKTETGNI